MSPQPRALKVGKPYEDDADGWRYAEWRYDPPLPSPAGDAKCVIVAEGQGEQRLCLSREFETLCQLPFPLFAVYVLCENEL